MLCLTQKFIDYFWYYTGGALNKPTLLAKC